MLTRLLLLGSPSSTSLSVEHVKAVQALSLDLGDPTWLAPNEACEFPYEPRTAAASHKDAQHTILAQVRAVLPGVPVDVALVSFASEGTRRKKLLVADMDSTLIEQECIDEMALVHGVFEAVQAITAQAMRGELEFESALRQRVALLRGLPATSIQQLLQERISLMSGARTLVATMKANGAYTALVSGGFLPFTSFIAETLQLDEHRGNALIVDDGRLSGAVRDPILGKDAKVHALRQILQQRDLTIEDSIAVGDGANDIPMLEEAGLGVALHAKPVVQAAADCAINYGDLTALLYLQGYRREEFVC